jgi:FixJ family two-component response regulator
VPSVVHVVDDDVSFQAAIRRRLQLAGYEVQVYSSAEQFLDQQPNDNNRSGCLLLDVNANSTQIAAQQRVTNQASESQTSTSSRFMVGFAK